MEDILNNYLNGNISDTRKALENGPYSAGDLLELYFERCQPSQEDVILFVKRLAR